MGPLPFSARPGSLAQETSLVSRDEFLAMKSRYLHQNRALAMQNSTMAAKVTEMEIRIAELVNENAIAKKRASQNAHSTVRLEEVVLQIESAVVGKVDEIFQCLKSLRSREGLSSNPKLDALSDRPVTSTPLDFPQASGFSPFGIKYLEVQEFHEGVGFPTKGFESSRSASPSVTSSIAVQEKTQKPESPSSSELGNDTINYLDDLSAVGKSQELSTLQETTILHNEEAEKSEPEELAVNLPKDRLQKSKGKKAPGRKISVLREDTAAKPVTKKQTTKPLESRKAHSASPELENKRPFRERKPVSYTVSLKGKMRRQSVKMVDAVLIDGDDGAKEIKLEQESVHKQEPVSKKRMPLAVVTNNANQLRSSNAKGPAAKKGSLRDNNDITGSGLDDGSARKAKKRRLTVV